MQISEKTVIVTGSEGFVAYHTIPLLIKHGYSVIRFDWAKVASHNVQNYDSIIRVLKDHPGCKILHLAAVARFAEADAFPNVAYATNGGGVYNVLRAAQEVGAERVVLASTASVYMPAGAWARPIAEYHPTRGNSHYGLSKWLGEQQVGFTNTPFVILRYAHLYGRMKWHGGLIDSFLERIKRGADPVQYGGLQSNDFTSVEDVATANLLALETPCVNEVYNIGTGEKVTTEEAVQILKELTGYTGSIEKLPMRSVDAPNFVLDIGKAKRLLGYKPKWSFREGLQSMLKQQSTEKEI